MSLNAVAGQKIYIGGQLDDKSTDFVAADFASQSWTEIDGWTQCGATGDTWFSDPALFLEVRPELRCETCLARAQAALSGGPTLAEMVARFARRGAGLYGDVAFADLALALEEIDRRLTALEGRAVAVHVGQGVTPIAGGLAYLGALPGVACVSPAGPVKVVRLDSTPAHLPTCGTAFRGCDPACPKDRAERGI